MNEKELIIPSGTTEINADTIEKLCTNKYIVESIDIPDSITVINKYTFYGCESLKVINLPDGITKINRYAFYGCKSLKNINIPNSVTEIDNSAFEYCKSLKTINYI